MKHDRLHALTDGIFAIVMTLLVLELKVPVLKVPSDQELWKYLSHEWEVFISYVISFALLFIYWRAHNFIISITAKNIDVNLLNINGLFLFLVGLVPFTTHLAGTYHELPLAITIYAINIILIGGTLLGMREYVERSQSIESVSRTASQRRAATVRTVTPMIFAAIAIPLSFINTNLAFAILLSAVLYNLLNNASDLVHSALRPFAKIIRRG